MTQKNNFSDITLEKYILGELDASVKHEIDEKIKTDAELNKRIENIKTSNKEITEKYDMKFFAAKTKKRIEFAQKRKSFGSFFPKIATALSFVILIMISISIFRIVETDDNSSAYVENIRIKGETRLSLYKLESNHVELIRNGECAEESSLIQIEYTLPETTYGAILSIDGNNNITKHFPINKNTAVKMDAGKKSLQRSYQLDNAPYFERFIMITSKSEFDIQQVSEKLLAVENKEKDIIALPFNNKQTNFILKKEIGGCRDK